jgi:hypothetical protein
MTARGTSGHEKHVGRLPRVASTVILVLACPLAAAWAVGCGARTGLEVIVAADAAPPDVAPRDSAAPMDSRVLEPDVLVPPPQPLCVPDAGCPAGFVCDPALGCVAPSYTETADHLFAVQIPTGVTMQLVPTGERFDDIALHPNGNLYAVTTDGVYTLDPSTGISVKLPGEPPISLDALGTAPDGTMYGAGGGQLFTVDPTTGNCVTVLNFPDGYASSGDLVVMDMGATIYVTVTDGTLNDPDLLLSVDVASMTTTVVGSTGFPCVWGLATYGAQLFGFTCMGHILKIDTATAASTILTSTGEYFCGATQR